ncbi:MAG: hypothetical protein KDC07_02925, partial [Chitinophagaceae bacterium]|nr:hypothetical protein [Chitinophagaceae bacterium]
MEDLVKKLTEEAGLTEEQALQALNVVKEYIMSKVPPMMHPMIDSFLAAKQDGDDPLGDMMKNLG